MKEIIIVVGLFIALSVGLFGQKKTLITDHVNTTTSLKLAQVKINEFDTDTALAANSNAKLPTQKAVKAYVDNRMGSGGGGGGDNWGSQVVETNSTLTGDGTSGTPLGIAIDGVGSVQIVSGAVGNSELASNSIDSSKIINGGISVLDLSQHGAAAGQVLKWNGIQWLPDDDDDTVASAPSMEVVSGTGAGTTSSTDFKHDISGNIINLADTLWSTKLIRSNVPAGWEHRLTNRIDAGINIQHTQSDPNAVSTANLAYGVWAVGATTTGTTVTACPNLRFYRAKMSVGNVIAPGVGETIGMISAGSHTAASNSLVDIASKVNMALMMTMTADSVASDGTIASGLRFWTKNTGGGTAPSGIQAMHINKYQNVGIGVNANQVNRLYVSGSPRFDFGGDATGDILYRNSAGSLTRLPVGAEGKVLKSVSGLPAWADDEAGSGGDDWGAQVVEHDGETLGGEGTSGDPLYWVGAYVDGPLTGAGLAVNPLNILNESILASHIQASAVTMPKIAQAGATTGQAIRWNGSAWAPGNINVTTDVAGKLQFENLTQGGALSVLGVAGSSSADMASISAGTDHYVLRRSGLSLGFGQIASGGISDAAVTMSKIAQSAATTGQVIKWNGSAWAPDDDETGAGAIYYQTLRDGGSDKTQRGKANFLDGEAVAFSLNDDSGNDETEITASLVDGGVAMSKIAQASATAGQALRWSGSAWAPATDPYAVPPGTENIEDANFTALIRIVNLVDCSGGAITVTPPSSPSIGDRFSVSDATASASTNNITIGFDAANQNLYGVEQDYILNINGGYVEFIYMGSTTGWIATK